MKKIQRIFFIAITIIVLLSHATDARKRTTRAKAAAVIAPTDASSGNSTQVGAREVPCEQNYFLKIENFNSWSNIFSFQQQLASRRLITHCVDLILSFIGITYHFYISVCQHLPAKKTQMHMKTFLSAWAYVSPGGIKIE